MITRRPFAAGFGAILAAPGRALALASLSQADMQQAEATQTPVPSSAPEGAQVTTLDAALDDNDRLKVPVLIEGRRTYRFTVDTGADRSVLTPQIVSELGLSPGPDVMVHGVSGVAVYPTAFVERLEVGDAVITNRALPILPAERIGAEGLIGVDILEGRNVVIDFKNKLLEVHRSRPRRSKDANREEITVFAAERFGRLTLADARIGEVGAMAFIDTGAGLSIGNMALANAIASKRRHRIEPVQPIQLVTAGGEMRFGQFRVVPSIKVGALRISNIPMAFADLHIFDVWSLNDRPAVLLGADVLRMFARVELDFGSARILFRVGQGGQPGPVLHG